MMYVEVCVSGLIFFFFFQAEDGIRDVERSRGLGDVYKRQEKERIEKAGGSVIDGRVERNLNLSRSLGDLQYKKRKDLPPEAQMITADPEFHTQKISPTFDFIVMGCDGIYETMNSKEIVSFFYSEMEKNPEEKLSKHVENFLDKSLSPNFASTSGLGCDNMSCILIQFLHSTQ
eukprot:TRINITY_DN3170_c0_g1_i10.p1 TRINITY_DN3170_c0_g1~~TRINITY_DN3170_c0_g1_i10.p1  ORF type:complete len:174 (+),score=40.08 TRINITY_DN3170_c0_g1_i10:79-600(+)